MERALISATCKPNTEAEISATATSSRRAGLSVGLSEVCECCPFVILFPLWVAFSNSQLAADSGQHLDCWEEIGGEEIYLFCNILPAVSCMLPAVVSAGDVESPPGLSQTFQRKHNYCSLWMAPVIGTKRTGSSSLVRTNPSSSLVTTISR
jgi:hypothetical protein